MSQEISINIKLANRNYRIKIAKENEEQVRNAILKIADKVNQFHKNFPGRDEQDYLAMTLIDFITTSQSDNQKPSSFDESELTKKLNQINSLFD